MTEYPIRLGTPEEFRAVRDFLAASNYAEGPACSRLGLKALRDLTNYLAYDRAMREASLRIQDNLERLVRLFIAGQYVPAHELARMTALPQMESLGLIRYESRAGIRMAYSPVLLYPNRGLLLVSDRFMTPEGKDVEQATDFVFLPLQANTQNMMDGLPATQCRSLLDIGTGCGIMGLWAARNGAGRVTLTDIAERSAHFAEFSKRLTGIENAEIVTGDMYTPVAGRRFDRILSHPPYDIGAETRFVFADGGEDGEQITRKLIAGAPEHLEPGGRLYAQAMGSHRKDALWENRVRGWLGEHSIDFDVALFVRDYMSTAQYAAEAVGARNGTARDMEKWRKRFDELGVTELVYGFIVLQRRTSERSVFTMRHQLGPRSGSPEIEWLLRWETAAADPSIAQRLRDEKPRASERFRLETEHRIEEADLRPCRYTFRVEHPLLAELTVPAWMAIAVSLAAKGSLTGAQIETALYDRGALPRDERGAEVFTRAMRDLVSAGVLDLRGFEPPPDPADHSASATA